METRGEGRGHGRGACVVHDRATACRVPGLVTHSPPVAIRPRSDHAENPREKEQLP